MRSYKGKIENKTFSFFEVLLKKLLQFWPLVLVAGVISLVVGYFFMLPDDYENLAESVVASNFGGNNILQAITTRNYWDVVNTYKPLMHTWYIATLIQCFVIIVLLIWIVMKFTKEDRTKILLLIVGIISFIMFILPFFSASDKFYYPQFRLFEVAAGGLLAYAPSLKVEKRRMEFVGFLSSFIVIFVLFSGIGLPSSVLLLIVVLLTCASIYASMYSQDELIFGEKLNRIISAPGKYSYEIYIWHQVVIAFLYYSVFQTRNIWLIIITIVGTAVLSFVTIFIRKHITLNLAIKIVLCIGILVCSTAVALFIYLRAGVVRNVPELGIDTNNIHRNMHAEYVDIPYSWDNDFQDDDRIHVLVLGDSFGRDFANILNESMYSSKLEISYIYGGDASLELDRVQCADFVFWGSCGWGVPKWILDNVDSEKLYIVGNKVFGNSNGIIYSNRNKSWYYEQTVKLSDDFVLQNNAMRGIYGTHYIDMIGPLIEGNDIKVFSDDNFYISQDCWHLTKYGAQYYSRILDLEFLLTTK